MEIDSGYFLIFYIYRNLIFRFVREVEVLERKVREFGEILFIEKRFDLNCIILGKVFWFVIIIIIFCNVYFGYIFNIFFIIFEIKCY